MSEEFTEKFDLVEHHRFAEPKVIDDVTFYRSVVCKVCKSTWGSLGTYEDRDLPFIKPEYFDLVGKMGPRPSKVNKVKHWKNVWFTIEDYE